MGDRERESRVSGVQGGVARQRERSRMKSGEKDREE